ncbi:MAG TPA: glycoside hydrolase family 30 beta sandwich domain-containing protein [Solirubrobacteraceae bacterium]|nr:glycoside hydrolase family 30 beta sandwich domain-containing protein [Solirubrobacteraceae bacterium]
MITAKGLCLTGTALAAMLALASPASARAVNPTRISRVSLTSLPQPLDDGVREKLTFTVCGGSGRLIVRVNRVVGLSRFQVRGCRERALSWEAPASAGVGYRVSVRAKIGRRPWSRTVSVSVGAVPDAGPGNVAVWLTTAGLREALSPMSPVSFTPLDPAIPTIQVSDATRYQRIIGFGAAMTDTSAWLLYDESPPSVRALAMAALFGPSGIGLNYVRVPIGASDFTATGVPYTYDDVPAGDADPSLGQFSIAHDEAYILPALRMMLALDPTVEILASPWSAPAWMKANDALDDLGYAGVLEPQNFDAYADYLIAFIRAYAQAGVPIAAITPENEAHTAAMYPSMDLDEDGFLTQNLVPTLRAAGLSTKVYGLDGSGLQYAEGMLSDPTVSSAIAGIAWHCYAGLEQMSELQAIDPSASMIMSECSPGATAYPTAETVIASLRNDAQAVDLWNLALDPADGPKQQAPGCDHCTGLVTVGEKSAGASLNLNYFQLGQVSKFVQRGAVRIGSDRWVSDFVGADGSYGVTPGLDDVALENPNGSKVLVAYDNSTQPIEFQVAWSGEAFTYTLARGATVTFMWH